MLTTQIYRSQSDEVWTPEALTALTESAGQKNNAQTITGILLYDGQSFFQVLEGRESVIYTLFSVISQDPRHYNVVELMRDYTAIPLYRYTAKRRCVCLIYIYMILAQ